MKSPYFPLPLGAQLALVESEFTTKASSEMKTLPRVGGVKSQESH